MFLNLAGEPISFMFDKRSLIDVILTNKLRSFKETKGFATGINDFSQKLYIKNYCENYLYRNVKRFQIQLSFVC